ncbi:MAG: hypothetical protein AAGJ35_13340, partial [Myxococcota bacterium]
WLALNKNAVTIGVGRHDNRNIAIIPMRSTKPTEARILLLHLSFNEGASVEQRAHLLHARGPVYDMFRAAVTEMNQPWSDQLLQHVPAEFLFDNTPDRLLQHLQTQPAH